MKTVQIACGAEAVVLREGRTVIKRRVSKGYRHPLLDMQIRTQRTRREKKLLAKARAFVPVPRVVSYSEKDKEIVMQFIAGRKLSDVLDRMRTRVRACRQIGAYLAVLHDAGIIHGDLTTSNMIVSKDRLSFVDFGLGFHSDRIEDKAVDLHVLHEALTSRHAKVSDACFAAVLEGYRRSKNAGAVMHRLEKVMRRGRYKAQF